MDFSSNSSPKRSSSHSSHSSYLQPELPVYNDRVSPVGHREGNKKFRKNVILCISSIPIIMAIYFFLNFFNKHKTIGSIEIPNDFNETQRDSTQFFLTTDRELENDAFVTAQSQGPNETIEEQKMSSVAIDEYGTEIDLDTSEAFANENSKNAIDCTHREIELKERMHRLENEVQKFSRLEAEEKFGPEPYQVQFNVRFINKSSTGEVMTDSGVFVVKMASLDYMPHSVSLFLHMIDKKLWDDTVFIGNCEHVIMALPISLRGEKRYENFEDAGFSSLSFQEYSEEYPHVKYSLGFAGRPGGPEFYISAQDNSEYHGPHGQDHHILAEEADPCFGEVIEGRDTVDRMNDRKMRERDGHVITVIEKIALI